MIVSPGRRSHNPGQSFLTDPDLQSARPCDGYKSTLNRLAVIPGKLPCERLSDTSLFYVTHHHDPSNLSFDAQRWGQSAGAMSVSLQLVANGGDTEGLFRGAIMQSGAPLPMGDVTLAQKHYNDLVLRTSCLHAEDTLDCLRHTPYETLKAATDASMGIFDYTVRALATRRAINDH
jgi:hypothetical protein